MIRNRNNAEYPNEKKSFAWFKIIFIATVMILCFAVLTGCKNKNNNPSESSDESQSSDTASEVDSTTASETEVVTESDTVTGEAPTETADETKNVDVPVDPSKVIYLTFDDGPHKENTEKVLAILREYKIKATFFTVGAWVKTYPEIVKKVHDEGHLIGCHSYTHDYVPLYKSADTVIGEIKKWESAVKKAIGSVPESKVFRFPGGTTCTALKDNAAYPAILKALEERGYRPFDWTAANNDKWLAGMKEGQTVADYFMYSLKATLSWVKDGEPRIVLMHDTSTDTVENLRAMLDYLIGEGYTFDTLDHYNGYYVSKKP